MNSGSTAPGWYADPVTHGLLRWWDGNSWGSDTAPDPSYFAAPPSPYPMAPPPVYIPVIGPNSATDLRDEERSGRRAAMAVLIAGFCYPVVFITIAAQASDTLRQFHDWWIEVIHTPAGTNPPQPPPSLGATSTAVNILQLGMLIVGILYLLWFSKAATVAGRIGLPAARRPVWAVLGFLVPVVNLWFPYQVARDLTPIGSPARTTAKVWWACYLGMSFGALPIYIVAWFSTTGAIVTAIGASGLAIAAALKARQLIFEVNASHRAILDGQHQH